MKQAVATLKSIRASRDFGIFANYYIAKGGRLYVSDGRMAASCPCPLIDGVDAMIPGDELEQLLSRLNDDIAITKSDGYIIIRSQRMHGKLQTLPTSAMTLLEPDQAWVTPPPKFVGAMTATRPFIADAAAQPYATCLCLRSGAMLATTNISLVEASCPELMTESDLLLPAPAIDFVLSVDSPMMGIILTPAYAAFQWDSGLWFRTQLVQGTFPAVVTTLLDAVDPYQPMMIGSDWRRAFLDVASISENIITIESARIIGGRGHARVEHEVEPMDLAAPVHFNPKYAEAVVTSATHWNLGAWPKPIPFIGDGFKGLLSGRQQ